jgi:hypothetical protein
LVFARRTEVVGFNPGVGAPLRSHAHTLHTPAEDGQTGTGLSLHFACAGTPILLSTSTRPRTFASLLLLSPFAQRFVLHAILFGISASLCRFEQTRREDFCLHQCCFYLSLVASALPFALTTQVAILSKAGVDKQRYHNHTPSTHSHISSRARHSTRLHAAHSIVTPPCCRV